MKPMLDDEARARAAHRADAGRGPWLTVFAAADGSSYDSQLEAYQEQIDVDDETSEMPLGKAAGDILRAVSSVHVLGSFGHHLRTKIGDAHTYGLSFRTYGFDFFLSHSWRDSGLLKYLALCYHLNLHAALAAALVASLLLSAYHLAFGSPLPLAAFPSMCPADSARGFKRLISGDILIAGQSAFLVVLLLGHRMPKLVRPRKVFLDKMCIHQTDADLKRQGILALDEFLHRSENMIVLYNDDYLERLWCVYELAAYTAFDLKADASNLHFLPLQRVPTILTIQAGYVIWKLGEYLAQLSNQGGGRYDDGEMAEVSAFPVPIAPIMLLVVTLFASYSTITAGQQKVHLLHALTHFSVASGKVYSEADRAIIEQAIHSWYAADDASELGAGATTTTGIARFERELHDGKIKAAVEAKLGKHISGLSPTDMAVSALPLFFDALPYALENDLFWGGGATGGGPMFFSYMFLVGPLYSVMPLVLGWAVVPLAAAMGRAGCRDALVKCLLVPLGVVAGFGWLLAIGMGAIGNVCNVFDTLP